MLCPGCLAGRTADAAWLVDQLLPEAGPVVGEGEGIPLAGGSVWRRLAEMIPRQRDATEVLE